VQDQDEWVVVLAGAAVVEVEGDRLDLRAEEWLFLPSGVLHTVLETEPGTSWLAVHLRR
jgi:cupin 2 domain-containing protein